MPQDWIFAKAGVPNLIIYVIISYLYLKLKRKKEIIVALTNEGWPIDMQEDLNQFNWYDEWDLVPRPQNKTVIGTKWIFYNKFDNNGIITRNKERLVEKGYNQVERIEYEDTYAPVANIEMSRILFAFIWYLDFKWYRINFKFAFLKDFINEDMYVSQPHNFEDHENSNYVFKLKQALKD